MATRALDVSTILVALQTLDQELQTTGWHPQNPAQRELFAWLQTYQAQLTRVTGVEAKASRFFEELNAFLEQKGFSLRLEPFDPTSGLGVVSVLEKLVRWLQGPGTLVTIETRRGGMRGFKLPESGVHLYEVAGYEGAFLLELLTQSEETLWLFVQENRHVEGLDLVKLALDVMQCARQTPLHQNFFHGAAYPAFAGAEIPLIEFDLRPDLTWLPGAGMTTASGDRYLIDQAVQQVKMRMDATGAHVQVATAMGVIFESAVIGPKVFTLDRPFYGWWTQRGVDLPMAVFFADWECWRTAE
jgi:hypothetical protein